MDAARNAKAAKSTKKKKNILLASILAAVTIVLGIVIYVLPMVSDALTSTWVLEYGSLQVTDKATCYAVRYETPQNVTADGSIQYHIEEGTMVRRGTKILDVAPGGGYTAQGTGIVSYYSDGKESYFTPESMVSLKYSEGNRVTVELPLGKIKCSVYKITDVRDGYQIILRCNRYYEDFCKFRVFENTTIITSDYEGLLVRNGSITTKDGKTGVYVKNLNGEYSFTQVSVISSNGEYSLLRSGSFYEQTDEGAVRVETVDAYDEILNSPKVKK